jgi:predicted RNA-binding Zn-ribbon protein involved in translation (DUF1610 family)
MKFCPRCGKYVNARKNVLKKGKTTYITFYCETCGSYIGREDTYVGDKPRDPRKSIYTE